MATAWLFLLTAIMNWTGIQTIHGKSLVILFSLWVIARLLFFFGARFLEIAALADMLFMAGLLAATATPIFKARQWRQLGVLSKVLLLTIGNICFYMGAFGLLEHGVYWAIYGGLYIIITLILTIAARVLPAFIRNGVDYEVTIANPVWVAVANIALLIPFFINQLFIQNREVLGYLSLTLFLVNAVRLVIWHTKGIWTKPLLWSLYLSIVFIDIGFLLFALTAFFGVSHFLAIHAFAFGGIGLATLGMMSRVVLGHTGRNLKTMPKLTAYALIILAVGAVIRIGFPLLSHAHYGYWMLLSQLAWTAAFALFLISYSRMLIQPRIDGQYG